MRAFLDTNVFLYAVGGPHPEREACRNLLLRIEEGSLDGTTSTEVVQELLFVLTRRRRRREALKLASDVTSLFPNLLPVTREDVMIALDLLQRYQHLSARDAIHAATMLGNRIATIISVDAGFDQLREIRRVAPCSA